MPGSGEPIDLDFERLALDANRGKLDEVEASIELTARVPADEDVRAEFLGEALDARGQVDRVADQRVGMALGAADVAGEHGAGVDPDTVPERDFPGMLAGRVPRGQAASHVEGGAHRHL